MHDYGSGKVSLDHCCIIALSDIDGLGIGIKTVSC